MIVQPRFPEVSAQQGSRHRRGDSERVRWRVFSKTPGREPPPARKPEGFPAKNAESATSPQIWSGIPVRACGGLIRLEFFERLVGYSPVAVRQGSMTIVSKLSIT